MKLPFPGMDPYLEHPVLWTSVHARFMVVLANQLKPLIRTRYVASVEERVYLEGPEQQRIPDVSIHKVRDEGALAGTATIAADTPLLVAVGELEVHEHFVNILDRYENERVVTVIEVVSPSNKAAGAGRDSYLEKRREALDSGCHLVEIDLLRAGRHVVGVPETVARSEANYNYLVCVNRRPQRRVFELYPRALRERLPRIRVPLAEPDPDAVLDLQVALEQVYDDGDYVLRVRYDEPCEPPLRSADQRWANECWAAYKAAHPDLFPPPAQPPG